MIDQTSPGCSPPLIFATVVVFVGAGLSFRIPQVGPRGSRQDALDEQTELMIDESEAMAETFTSI